jgi:uncharacterized lipoprotein YmbA
MKYLMLLFLAAELTACASASVAQKLNFVAFEDQVKVDQLTSAGNIDGKDCTWYVGGYALGMDPSVRNAFTNAASQHEGSLIPGQKMESKGAPLKVVRNISVEENGFNAYIASRRCVIVTGAGFR